MSLFYTCPVPTKHQQYQRSRNTLNPYLQAFLSQLQQPRETPAKPSGKKQSQQQQPVIQRNYNRFDRAFSPRFDVYETNDAYYLQGDLPGVSDKKSLSIEFSDARTVLVRGRVDPSIPKPESEDVEGKAEEEQQERKRRSLNPTVEDTDDEDDFSIVSDEKAAENKKEETKEEVDNEQERPATKVWLSERTFGTFQRTFSFPESVNIEGVEAKLDNGLLQVTVPKLAFGGARKIEIE